MMQGTSNEQFSPKNVSFYSPEKWVGKNLRI